MAAGAFLLELGGTERVPGVSPAAWVSELAGPMGELSQKLEQLTKTLDTDLWPAHTWSDLKLGHHYGTFGTYVRGVREPTTGKVKSRFCSPGCPSLPIKALSPRGRLQGSL